MVVFSCQEAETPNKTYLTQPKTETKVEKPVKSILPQSIEISYKIVDAREWLLKHTADSIQEIAFAVNRTDRSNFYRMDSVIVPSDLSYRIADYLPFPKKLDYEADIHKLIYFSYATQTFAAYENGILVHTGPTNMGRENRLTPSGLFFTNWKAKITTSTVNAEWILNWNFNLLNKEGVGWHQYSLPGYPVSHSCMRLQEKDAYFLYYWADQWVLANPNTIKVKGTPVIIFGAYDFGLPKPWLNLVFDPHSLDITIDELEEITQPYFYEIRLSQQRRDSFQILNQESAYE